MRLSNLREFDVQEIRKSLERAVADFRFFSANSSSFMEQYPNQWIAIFNQEVVGTSESQNGLISKLKKTGINPAFCYMQFLDPDPKTLILQAI